MLKTKILICCLILSTAFAQANLLADTVDEGTPVLIKKKGNANGLDKSDPAITASISGHTLTMNLAQSVGMVTIEISNTTGTVQSFAVVTPDNVQAYITNSGSYTVTFTLANGDEYYGNFVVF